MPLLDLGASFVAKTKAKAVEVNAKFDAIKTLLNVTKLDALNIQNDALTAALLHPDLRALLGVSGGGTTARGKKIIDTEETRNVNSYDYLTTPDRVSNVTLPDGGLLIVRYQAQWKLSAGTGRAALFLGAQQIKISNVTGPPILQEVSTPFGAAGDNPPFGYYRRLLTGEYGLRSLTAGVAEPLAADEGADVTTGQIAGGFGIDIGGDANWGDVCAIFAAPGTYDVGVKFVSDSGGTLSVRGRKLWVQAIGF